MSKNFPFTRGGGRGGVHWKNFFFQSEHVSSQIWCQKFFPLLGVEGGQGPSKKIFFFQSEHVSRQILYQAKSKSNLVSKKFPFTRGRGGGCPLKKNFFSQSEHVSSQIWCQKFFPLLGGGPSTKIFFTSLNMYQAKSGVKKFSLY